MPTHRLPVIWVSGLALVLAAVVVGVGALWTLPRTEAGDASDLMSLSVKSALGRCNDPTNPTECSIPTGARFTLAVQLVAVPSPGYVAFQSFVDYGGELVYNTRASAADEITWPACRLPLRSVPREGLVVHGCLSGLSSPPPISTHAGNIVELAFTCSAAPSQSAVELLAGGDPRASTLGSAVILPDGVRQPSASDSITIYCGPPPPPTPAPSSGEISVMTYALAVDGTSPYQQACKADAIVVVSAGRIVGFKARNPSFSLEVGDTVGALAGRTGASFLSVDERGIVRRGLRDCVEVTR